MRPRLRFYWVLGALGLVGGSSIPTGCSTDAGDAGESSAQATSETTAATTGDTMGDEAESSGAGGQTTGSSSESGAATGESGGPDDHSLPPFSEADWARGDVRIDRVEVNQGIGIPVVVDGMVVPVNERTGGLVKNRNALLSAFWSVPENWESRPITARLYLRNGAGEIETLEVTKTLEASASAGGFTSAISWQLPAATFEADLEFFIELREGEEGHESIAPSTRAPAAPQGGMQPLGVPKDPMELKVVMVPVQYDYGTCHTDTTEVLSNNFQAFADHLFVQNPVETLHIEQHPSKLVITEQITTLSQINTALVVLRFQDFAEPNEYYFALLNACSGGVDGAGGIAPGTPGAVKGLGNLRVSTGLWTDISWSKETFVHEVGHTQGRPHSPCGNPAGADADFPHDNAHIGSWGFNILTGHSYNPNVRYDYMSYCSPTWVSDWTWNLAHQQIRELTSWDYTTTPTGHSTGGATEILEGWVHPSGLEQWWTSPGDLPGDMLSVAENIAFYDEEGGLIDEVPAATWTLEDGVTQYFMAAVPDSDLDLVAGIVRSSRGMSAPIPRHRVRRLFDRAR